MRYLLDSNTVIDILRSYKKVKIKYQLESIKGNEVVICSVIYYEILRGFVLPRAHSGVIKEIRVPSV